MASLTHVCMWSDKGWKRITAEQAAKMHPGGTVSAYSGLFMCELCGQYVTLTDGYKNARHFRHSSHEKSKDCPERTFGANYAISYDSQDHDLPIRIVDVSSTSFRFELGLIRAPISTLGKSFRVEIRPKGEADVCYMYTKERLNCDGITYLPIGETPYERYALGVLNGNERLREFWPTEIKGIDPDGTLFEKGSGRRLIYDADVEIGKEYYLIIRGFIYREPRNGICIQEILRKRFEWQTWSLYVVSASAFNEDAARFYLNFHCRLTDHPVSLQPVWPLFVEGNYVIRHNQNSMYMLVDGNAAAVKTFPTVAVRQLNNNASQQKLYEVLCAERQQLISAGRTRALQYTYLWKEPLDQAGSIPEVVVTDPEGEAVPPGEISILPRQRTLRIKTAYDGEFVIRNDNCILDKRRIAADKTLEIDGLEFGFCVEVVIGHDTVWQADFRKQQSFDESDENEIIRQLTHVSGAAIPAPHSLRNILIGMKRYPLVCQWIRKCMKDGTINEQAFRRLQNTYLGMRTKG